MKDLKKKCKCGHRKDVHGGENGRDDYEGGCNVQYPSKETGYLKGCYCNTFSELKEEVVLLS